MGSQTDAGKSKPKDEKLFIFVDGEKFIAPSEHMTPHQIIDQATELDPAQHYLVRVHGNDQTSYQGQEDQPIHLEKAMKFLVIFAGGMTVSDIQRPLIGTTFFADGLSDLGYAVGFLSTHPDHVYFDYQVPAGCYAGQTVKLGFQVPPDFPTTPPSGPHTSPCLRPSDQPGAHPNGGRHTSQAQPFANELGGNWQYWSRPCNEWDKTNKTVSVYMAFIAKLWATQ
jgi:hypothetical protein